jgi:hypothetical protein
MSLNLYHGAHLNSGDFLIKDSFKKFLGSLGVPIANEKKYSELGTRTWDGSTLDLMCGGPVLEPKFIRQIGGKAQGLHAFGAGSYLIGHSKGAGRYQPPQRADDVGFAGITFRDEISNQLYAEGRGVVTGCSASYHHPSYLSELPASLPSNRIALSAPQRFGYFSYTHDLARFLRAAGFEVDVIFNRGWEPSKHTSRLTQTMTAKFVNGLREDDFPVIDASGASGMSIYGAYQRHIGFRLHSHYYMLARHKQSILLVEDSRGLGSNQLFGLPSIFPLAMEIDTWALNTRPSKVSALFQRVADTLLVRRSLGNEDKTVISQFIKKGIDMSLVASHQERLYKVGKAEVERWAESFK